MERPFRFGYQLTSDDEGDPVAAALAAEAAGFDTVLVSDHVGPGVAPMVTLAAIAQATTRTRVGTFVLNNDMRNPVQLAWETATLDRLSGGRFELGLGAGHTPHEYAETGIRFDHPRVRKARLMEGVEVVRRLLDGETVSHHGEHVVIEGASVDRAEQTRLPILVGGNGEALLRHAGAHADIVGLQGLGRTRRDGHRHTVRWDPAWLDTQLDQIRSGAGERFDEVELNALVQFVEFTGDAVRRLAELAAEHGLDAGHLAEIPYVLVGTVDEIAAKLRAVRDRWGISYVVVRERERFAGVIAALAEATDHVATGGRS